MTSLLEIGEKIASTRKAHRLSQKELATRAGVSRGTVEALENGRTAELGFTKLTRLLAVLGLDFALREENLSRPTLDELRAENRNA